MKDEIIINQDNNWSDKVKIDFNVIELPLFSQNSKLKSNIGAIYTIDKKRNIVVEIVPGAGLTIPNDFDQRVYLALVQIAIEFKERHGFHQIPNKIYTTYYEIFSKLRINMRGDVNERIYQSLEKLQATVYKFWNCFYNAEVGIRTGVYKSNFIHSIAITPTCDKSAREAMSYIGTTKSSNVITLELNPLFLDNIIHKKGNLTHKFNDLISLSDSVARSIYLYCDKNRYWIGKKYFKTDKKIRITAKKLANIIPLSFKVNSISITVNRIRKAFEFLYENDMIVDFVEYKGKPLSETYYEVSFGWSRDEKEYVITGREEFEISCINEVERTETDNNQIVTIEEMREIDFNTVSTNCITSDNIIDAKVVDEIEIHPDIIAIIEPVLNKIKNETKKLLNEFYLLKGKAYIQASIEYTNLKSKTNYNKYLQDTITQEWAISLIEKYKNQEARHQKIEQEKLEKQLALEQQNLEEQKQHAERKLIEHEYYKLSNNIQSMYTNFADSILKKHQDKLVNIFGDKVINELVFCVYAVATNSSYNKILELHIQHSLQVDITQKFNVIMA